MYILAVQNQKQELSAKQKDLEQELEDLFKTLHKELEGVKGSVLQGLNKKADFSLVDSLKDAVHKKVDSEYLQQTIGKVKQDTMN